MSPRERSEHAVLVLDAEQRSALSVVRSLGGAGYRVDTGASDSNPLAGASRYSRRTERLPDPMSNPAEYRDAVRKVTKREGYSVVLPVTEMSALALLGDPVIGPKLPMPSSTAFHEANDKVRLMERASSLGLDVPRSITLSGPDDSAANAWTSFPAVLKPGRSVVGPPEARRRTGVQFVDDAEGLRSALDELHPTVFPVMIQERLRGPGVGVFLLVDRNELVASFAHRRIREKPPRGGVSVYRESIRPAKAVVDQAERLLRSYDWRGVAMVEFKHDVATDRHCVMEINGRFWGSLQLAVDAGVDFPRLLVDRFLDLSREICSDYRVGIRLRWEWGDVDHMLIRLRRGGGDSGFATWFRPWWPGDRFEVLRLSDPMPFLAESGAWLRGMLDRLR